MCSDEGRGQSDLDRPLAARVAPAIGSATSGVRSRLAASYHRPGAHAHRSVAGTFPSPLQAPRPQVRGAFWFSDPMPVSGPSRWPGPYRAPRPSGERPRPGRTRRRRWPAPGPGWRAGSRPRRPPSARWPGSWSAEGSLRSAPRTRGRRHATLVVGTRRGRSTFCRRPSVVAPAGTEGQLCRRFLVGRLEAHHLGVEADVVEQLQEVGTEIVVDQVFVVVGGFRKEDVFVT